MMCGWSWDASLIDWSDDKIYAMLSVEGMCGIDRDPEARIDWLYAQGRAHGRFMLE